MKLGESMQDVPLKGPGTEKLSATETVFQNSVSVLEETNYYILSAPKQKLCFIHILYLWHLAYYLMNPTGTQCLLMHV